MSLKDAENAPLDSRDILDEYRMEITAIGKIAFEALLKSSVFVDLKELNSQMGTFTAKMIRSGLFQFSRLSSTDPNKTILFLHKSIQEFLAAWYLMNDARSEERQLAAALRRIDSFGKALKLKEILKFMCEWSVEGAKAAFKLLKYIGKNECLTECCFTITPSLDDLSLYQGAFRDFSLECLISCSASTRQEVYPLFLSAVGGVMSVNTRNIRKVSAGHILRSSSLPSHVFFERGSFYDFVSIVDDLRAVVVTCSALRLKASDFLRMSVVSELQSEHFFLKKEGDKVYLYFSRICKTHSFGYDKMLRDLTSPLAEDSQAKEAIGERSKGQGNGSTLSFNTVEKGRFHGNCFSMVKEVKVFVIWTREQLTLIRDLLSAVASPRDVIIRYVQVDNDVVSRINFTENLSSLILDDLKMTTTDATFVACSLHQGPNLYSFAITNSLLQGDSVKFLCENLCNVPRLSFLTLSKVGMDTHGCSSLATSLKHLAKLTVLNLSKNPLGQGITELAKQLKNVPRLLHLNMERTNMGEEEATALTLAIKSDVSALFSWVGIHSAEESALLYRLSVAFQTSDNWT